MRVETITDDAALHSLAPEWRDLWHCSGASPFQSPAWMLVWWHCFGNRRPVIAVARDDAGAITGLLACYLLDGTLLPMGAGITDYQDVLGAHAEALLVAVLGASGAAACDLTDLPPDAALRTAPAPRGWRASLYETDPCPVLAGPIPPGRLRDIRQARHRAERRGGWCVEIATPDNLDNALAAFERLHALRWSAEDSRIAALRRLAAPALLDTGVLRLALLRIGGEIAAGCYGLLAPHRLLLYVSGFDPRFAYESPGTILLGRLIEDAAAEGREVHFLRGGEAYKYAWGGVDRMNATRSLVPA